MPDKVSNQRFVNSCLVNSPSVYCLRRDFAHKTKSRGGTPVTRAYFLKKYLQLKYTVSMQEKVSICLNRGRGESVGNDDVSLFAPKSPKLLGRRQDRKSRRHCLGRFCNIYCAVIRRYSFALRVNSDILWHSCFESYGLKDTR